MFCKIQTKEELAEVLGFPLKKLTFYAYSNERDFYTEFAIKNKMAFQIE